jgi:hypothetical protein
MNLTSIASDRRRLLVALAVLLGLAEFAAAFAISFWEAAAVLSALFLVAAWWTRRGGIGGPILVGVLCVFELLSYPTLKRNGLAEWITQSAFAVAAAACLIVALAVLKRSFAERRKAKQAPLANATPN